ncbi:MAG: uroporphyrinogen decarboxylase [Planctomycetota bacterium]|nr:uroporphyrinogen decarboxylase [Planctomycetota bacterium]
MTTSDTLLLKALRREPVPRPPVWLMRQAGRYLPEYQEVRRKAGGFLAMCHAPELAAEVTLQPLRRFGMDAAILFSDILLPLAAMGMPLEFQDGRGPVLPKPLRSADDVNGLLPVVPEESLGYVGDALECTAAGLPKGATLLGFCGAPYTLASYAIEGGTSKSHAHVRQLMYSDPGLFENLMSKLAETSGQHLAFQASRGAQAVVLFDTWAGTLGREDYLRYALPWSKRALEIAGDAVPRIHFVLNGKHLLEDVVAAGSEAVAVDWRVSIADCMETWGDQVAFQGNLDPSVLLGPPDLVAQRTREILDAVGGRPGHVMGLGHGVHKETDPECVAAFVDTVKASSVTGNRKAHGA